MSLIRTTIKLINPQENSIAPIDTECLVDIGALHLCIPESLAIQLKLNHVEDRPVTFANGETKMCKYVGPIIIKWENRTSIGGAMVLGDEVLLGAIPIEDMDLIIHPAQLKITVNPLHPNFPASVAK